MKLTLCGSSRFEQQFHEWNEDLTFSGHVVYSLAVFPSTKDSRVWYTKEQKSTLDAIHYAKILNSDGIVVLNVNNYIGDSTKNEIQWAKILEKQIYYLEGIPNVNMLLL